MTADQIREQVPQDARLFPLIPRDKKPRSEHAHHDAVLRDQFLALYVSGNYGIALDGQFLLVDRDRGGDAVDAFEKLLPQTWMQKTWKRGTHRVYRVPKDFHGKNTVWVGGEIKVNGYLVGPGSFVQIGTDSGTYEYVGGQIADAPDWLLEMVTAPPDSVQLAGTDFDIIRAGRTGGPGRDNELTRFAGFARNAGYSEQFIAAHLAGMVNVGIVEQPPGDEITARDIARIAKSVSRYPAGLQNGHIAAADWVCGTNVQIVGAPVRWWLRGFFPKSDMIMCFGAKGVGKSSLSSWLASEVTQAGGSYLFVGVEEPFARFLGRAVLCGADRARVFAVPQASRLVLPRDIPKLREQVAQAGIDVVYFDSIVTHFEHVQGQNIAERTRRCLGPLAEMAQEQHVTVVGVFHENREGDYMGSAEMVNVARVVLHAEREKEPAGQPLIVSVHSTNLWEPQFSLAFQADEVDLKDPETGQVQMEEVDGQLVAMTVRVPRRVANRDLGLRMSDLVDKQPG